MSALGGALSLYLGVAIILIFELFEMAAKIFMNVWKYLTAPTKMANGGGVP